MGNVKNKDSTHSPQAADGLQPPLTFDVMPQCYSHQYQEGREEVPMRIVIFGTGGAGGYFGAQLARAGKDVIFIARGKVLFPSGWVR
jgi:pyruvate/2-oxoglutarate dehydrogenase complex dihydrolipoamide dehydrogenase (E3) component